MFSIGGRGVEGLEASDGEIDWCRGVLTRWKGERHGCCEYRKCKEDGNKGLHGCAWRRRVI